jgi:hypothetical protein
MIAGWIRNIFWHYLVFFYLLDFKPHAVEVGVHTRTRPGPKLLLNQKNGVFCPQKTLFSGILKTPGL